MRAEKFALVTGFIIFSVLFFIFYPPTYGIVDEAAYLSTAYAYQNGTIYYDRAGMESVPAQIAVNMHTLSRYAPGNSLFLLPFTLVLWKSVFLRGYLLIALGFGIMILSLAHFKLPIIYGLLFLFHPAIALYSRTIMSDLPATILVLVAFFFLFKNRPWAAGLIFSAGVTVRYPVLLVPVSVCVALAVQKQFTNIVKLLIGLIIGLLPLVMYHLSGFRTIFGPMPANAIGFSIFNIPRMLPQFLISLAILYPLMLVLPFFSKLKDKWMLIAPAMTFLVFFSTQYYLDKGGNFAQSLVRGQRFMLPIIPLLLLPYIEVVHRIKAIKKSIIPVVFLLVVISAVIFHQHQQFLKQQAEYVRILYDSVRNAEVLICNKDIYELVNPYLGYIMWQPFEDRGELLSLEKYQNIPGNIYLACLARDEKKALLFKELLAEFSREQEIITASIPYYFSIWRVSADN